jgi:hypothetical protein
MQSNVTQITRAITKVATLGKAQDYFRDCLPTHYPTNYGTKFSSSNDGKSLTVSMPALGQDTTATGRPIWNGSEWKLEYVFFVTAKEIKHEVFRFYLNDDGQVENFQQEIFGSPEGADFLNYLCSGVFVGTLNSSVFAATPLANSEA